MGLAGSRHRRASDVGSASSRKLKERPSTDVTNTDRDFSKSQSMPTLDRDRKGTLSTPANGVDKKATKTGSSMRRSESAAKRNDSLAPKTRPPLRRQSTSNKIQSNGYPRQKSIRRDISHPITACGREIIVQCFDNPHSEFGNKVCQRVFEKRPDYQNYVYQMGKEKAYQMTQKLKDLVENIVSRIDDVDHIVAVSRTYGEDHVELKPMGFKPDFWVALADAMTVEGVILDMANHQPADTVGAWSQLVSLIFSSVRDGYYSALRVHRMNSRKSLARQATSESTNNGETSSTPIPSSRNNSLNGRCTEVSSSPRGNYPRLAAVTFD